MFTGYRIELENRRSLRASSQRLQFTLRDFDAPRTIDHSRWLRKENQGPMGSCRGWTRAHNAEISYKLANSGEETQFSALWCYIRAQAKDGLRGDVGATIAGGAWSALNDGHAFEETVPYPNPVRYTDKLPAEAFDEAKSYRCESQTLRKTYDEVRAYLAGNCGGIDFGGPWPLPIDRFRVMSKTGPFGGAGHAWAIVGYVDDADIDEWFELHDLEHPGTWKPDPQGRPSLVGFNQHNFDGAFLIRPTAAEALFRHQYSVLIGLSHMDVPEPVAYDFIGEGLF